MITPTAHDNTVAYKILCYNNIILHNIVDVLKNLSISSDSGRIVFVHVYQIICNTRVTNDIAYLQCNNIIYLLCMCC